MQEPQSPAIIVTMKSLSYLVIIAVIASVHVLALTEEQIANWKKWSEECQNQSGASEESINKLRIGDFTEPDSKIQTHILCFSKKAGLANDAGEFLIDNIKAKVRKVVDSDEEADKIVAKCAVKNGTPEETAYNAYKCLKESKPKFMPL